MTSGSPQRFIAQIYPRDLRLRILVLRSYCKVSNNLVSDQPSTQAHQINSNLALASFVFQIFWLFTQVQIPISDTNFYLSTYLFPRLSKFLKSEDFSQTGVTKIFFLLFFLKNSCCPTILTEKILLFRHFFLKKQIF